MLIFAHRGASADAPENTLLAVEKALEQGADGIEIDIHQVENELVVIHDRWVNRTTNGNGSLEHYTLEEINALDAGIGEQVPTLWQVLERVKAKCLVNIEIKGVKDVSLVRENINRALDELGYASEQFLVSSFDHHLLEAFKGLAANIRIGGLTACKPIDYAMFAEKLGAYSVNVDVTFLDQTFIADAKKRGLKIFVYTVDEADDLKRLQEWGVDGVFSNGPGRAKLIISR